MCPCLLPACQIVALGKHATSLVRVLVRFPQTSLVGTSLLTDRSLLALVAYARGPWRDRLESVRSCRVVFSCGDQCDS
jgi:hypothetical protein